MNLRKCIFPIIIVITLVCSSVVFYSYNSKIADIQSITDEQKKEILTLQTQIDNCETQLQSSFFIQSYVNWIAIPRSETSTIPLTLQSQYEIEDNCTVTIKNEVNGVICNLNATTLPLYSERLSYVALTIAVTDVATVGNYGLIIEAEMNELVKIEIINLTVL